MRYVVKIGGSETPVEAKPMKVVSAKPDRPGAGSVHRGRLKASWKDAWDYDGTVHVDLTLQTSDKTPVSELDAGNPFLRRCGDDDPRQLRPHPRACRAEAVPKGNGMVWDARRSPATITSRTSAPTSTWAAASAGSAGLPRTTKAGAGTPRHPNVEVVRRGGQVVLLVHLINQPTVIDKPQTLIFGLLAAPVKPPMMARARDPTGGATATTATITTCSARTSTGWRSATAVRCIPQGRTCSSGRSWRSEIANISASTDFRSVVAKGRKYFEPYGKVYVDHFVAARGNLRSRYGENMVFYYNRATCQLFPETETFKDEWLLDDYRGVGKGNGAAARSRSCRRQSYIDYNLYWYVKSFEIGNNQGVYWDNYFICPSFNTEMTDAYQRPDGTIVPASGIWGLRELCKRTFIMKNERGMQIFTFPHMTSFSPLPMLSFATCQLDWEWKYSEGDVQNRFTREYLQLVTDGELAGAWPVPLHEQAGAADQRENQWVQRTFTAVRLVHELDGIGGFGQFYQVHQNNLKVAKPVIDILDSEGLKVYKYWEERPQPVKATSADFPCIVYSVPGKEALVVVTSYAGKDDNVSMTVDAKALGFTGAWTTVNTETGAAVPATDGRLTFPLKMHDVCVLRLTATQM